jgi:hypothetical protein
MFQNIILPSVYIAIEQWNVSKMKSPHNVHFLALIQIIHQRDIAYYFNNINVISYMMMVDQGKLVDWAYIMFK